MSEHPTDLDLELARTGEANQEIQSHLKICAECRERSLFLSDLNSSLNVGALPRGCPETDIPVIDVSSEQDATILDMIQKRSETIHHERTVKKSKRAMRWILPIAAAASIVIGLGLGLGHLTSPSQQGQISAQVAAAGPDDINADGEVNIIDALILARSGDHKKADVDRIARTSVALNTGGAR